MTQRLTQPQAAVAHQLARAFGHHWSVLSVDEVVGKTSEEIHALSTEREAPGTGCQHTAPTFSEFGGLEHVTHSGRLHWQIDDDGTARFQIHRPLPDGQSCSVMQAVVPPTDLHTIALSFAADDQRPGTVRDWLWLEGDAPGQWTLPRHLAAMHEAISALEGNPNREVLLDELRRLADEAAENQRRELDAQLKLVRTDTTDDIWQVLDELRRRVSRMEGPEADDLRQRLSRPGQMPAASISGYTPW